MLRRERICAVYRIRNTINDRAYIGSSIDVYLRWRRHKSHLRDNRHHAKKLQRSWNKHGEAVFVFEILEIVDSSIILQREQFWLDELKAVANGFNSNPASDSNRGGTLTEEHKAKIAAGVRGKKRRPLSDEARKRHGDIRRGIPSKQRGRSKPEEQRAKISATLSGRKQTPEVVGKRVAGWKARFPDGAPEYLYRASAARWALSPERSAEIAKRAGETRRLNNLKAKALLPPSPPPTERYLKWSAAVADKRVGWSEKAKARWARLSPEERRLRVEKAWATRRAKKAALEAIM